MKHFIDSLKVLDDNIMILIKYFVIFLAIFVFMIFCGLSSQKSVYPSPPLDFNPHNKVVFIEDVMGKNGIMDFNFGEIVIMDINTGIRFQVTNDQEYDIHPSWSPDGQKIIFESKRSSGENPILGLSRKSHLYIVKIRNKKIEQVDKTFQRDFSNQVGEESFKPVWNPIDENVICFVSKPDKKKGHALLQYNFQTNKMKTLISSELYLYVNELHWSPDGKYIAINCSQRNNSIVYSFTDNKAHYLFDKSTTARPSGFSSDSEKVFFVSFNDIEMKDFSIQYNLNKKSHQILFQNINSKFDLDFSKVIYQKDNFYFLVGVPKGHFYNQLYLVKKGEKPKQLTDDGHDKTSFRIFYH
jgi:tricorn protease-like protein